MACSGCERRREWLKKWKKIAYERATGKSAAGGDEKPDSSDEQTGRIERNVGGADHPES